MKKISKDYWGSEILFLGCEKKDVGFYKMLQQRFTAAGVEVYALPTNPELDPGFATYPDLDALPHIPQCAYIMGPAEEFPEMVEELRKAGVTRLLVYNKKKAADDFVADCESKGMEVRAGCPLMIYGSFPCTLHAAFGGVRDERSK